MARYITMEEWEKINPIKKLRIYAEEERPYCEEAYIQLMAIADEFEQALKEKYEPTYEEKEHGCFLVCPVCGTKVAV